jgi:hypothetical protein
MRGAGTGDGSGVARRSLDGFRRSLDCSLDDEVLYFATAHAPRYYSALNRAATLHYRSTELQNSDKVNHTLAKLN